MPALPALDEGPRPPVPVSAMPRKLQAKARWVDETFGAGDGRLTRRELTAYKRAFGSDAGHTATIAALERQLDLETPGNPSRPPSPAARTVTRPVAPASAEVVARQLTRAGGRGTRADVDAVATSLARLPAALLERASRGGVTVVACRDSVTDHLTSLRGVQPRGWPPGSTWDSVPGLYDPVNKQLVIATHSDAAAARVLPSTGYGHGSFDALLHEFGHAIDDSNALGADSRSRPFRAAYERDRPAMTTAGTQYLLQPGDAGPQEAFAEVAARYFGKDPALPGAFPNMTGFFRERADALRLPS
jgi:hypothetical protein